MNRWIALAVLVFLAAVGAGGYLLGLLIQSPADVLSAINPSSPAIQNAPIPIEPMNGSEFVDSDIRLAWSWSDGLKASQLFALRVWADNRPRQEIWTTDDSVSVQQTIDSFSIDFGVFYWQVAVVNLNSKKEYDSMGSDWSDVTAMQRLRRERIPARAYDEMSAGARHFDDMELDATTLIDSAHRFIKDYSLLEDQLSYAPDYSDAVDLMFNFAQGTSVEQPQLLCDGRATAMLTLLQELGVESRLVFLYTAVPGYLAQHTVLEIFNPDIQRWQVHDVAGEFYFIDAKSAARVSAARILFGSRDDLEGCPIDGGNCSFETMRSSAQFFSALRYGYTYEVWVNPDRFDLSKRFEAQGRRNLAEFISDDDPKRVTIRMDNWQ